MAKQVNAGSSQKAAAAPAKKFVDDMRNRKDDQPFGSIKDDSFNPLLGADAEISEVKVVEEDFTKQRHPSNSLPTSSSVHYSFNQIN